MNMTRREALKQTAALGAAAGLAPGLLRGQSASAPSKIELPDLPYDFSALEPAIDTRTMRIHHGRHHAGYVNNYNRAVDSLSGSPSLEHVLADLNGTPEIVRTALRNNGGGAYNHDLFWKIMAPVDDGGGSPPTGELAARINREFGSLKELQRQFSEAASGVFGSGWAWLIERSSDGNLAIVTTPNQDNPLMRGIVSNEHLGNPLLGLDVWEHAYYLHYQNRRGDYIANWWKVVNWTAVAERAG